MFLAVDLTLPEVLPGTNTDERSGERGAEVETGRGEKHTLGCHTYDDTATSTTAARIYFIHILYPIRDMVFLHIIYPI